MTLREKFDNELIGIDEMTQELWDWFVENGYEIDRTVRIGSKRIEIWEVETNRVSCNGFLQTVTAKEFLASVKTIKPRIKIVCEGFDEGQEFKIANTQLRMKYKITGNTLYKSVNNNTWIKSDVGFNDFVKSDIKLIKEPTELEKLEKELQELEKELQELADKHKKEMYDMAEKIKEIKGK